MALNEFVRQWVNANNLEVVWEKIKENFVQASLSPNTGVGAMLYWDAASTKQSPVQPKALSVPASNKERYVLGVDDTNSIPQWKTVSSSLAFSETTANQPKLKITVLGTDSSPYDVPLAGAGTSGFVSQTTQIFAGLKKFNGGIRLPNAQWVYADDTTSSSHEYGNVILGINNSNKLLLGYGLTTNNAAQPLTLETHVYGTQVMLHYGASRTLGVTLDNNGDVTVVHNIQSTQGGVAAMGLADLAAIGGGGGSNASEIYIGSTPYPFNENGQAYLPAYPSDYYTQAAADNKFATIAQLNTINAKIPSAATSSNQLADKAFVNSSIATATATFRGTNTTATTETDFITWANGLTHNLNDYVFWKTTDSVGNVVFKRYKYGYDDTETGTLAWRYEYDLNNSSFTSDQWNAINSFATSTIIGNIIPKTIGTTAGDILYFSAANTPARLGLGSAGQYLKVGSGAPAWASFATPTVAWTEGGSAGPTLTVTTDGGSSTAVAIPAARAVTSGGTTTYYSGVVTTGNQQFNGIKTFNNLVESYAGLAVWGDLTMYNGYTPRQDVALQMVEYPTQGSGEGQKRRGFSLYSYENTPSSAEPSTGVGYAPMCFGTDGTSSEGILFFTGNKDYTGVTNSNYWGVNTFDPQYRLHVNGTFGVTGVATFHTRINLDNYRYISFKDNPSGGATAEYIPTLGIDQSNHLTLGWSTAQKGYITLVAGNTVQLYYGTNNTLGTLLDSNGILTNIKSIQSTQGGVSANGLADLSTSGGGGGTGTVKTFQVNSATAYGPNEDGKLNLSASLSGNTTNAIVLTLGGANSGEKSTLNLSAANLRTYLGLGTVYSHGYGEFVTALGVSGNTLTWSKGGTAQTAITVPYATNADTLDGKHNGELTATDNKTELKNDQEFVYRKTNVTWGATSATIRRIKGRTLAWNQYYNLSSTVIGKWTESGATVAMSRTYTDNSITATVTTAGTYSMYYGIYPLYFIPDGHKVYFAANIKPSVEIQQAAVRIGRGDVSSSPNITLPANAATRYSKIGTITNGSTSGDVTSFFVFERYGTQQTLAVGTTITISDVVIVDLTQMFGDGNEPSTTADFEAILTGTRYPYTAGELINNDADGLESGQLGFNIWDEEWMSGYINNNDGTISAYAGEHIVPRNFIPIKPSTTYYRKNPYTDGTGLYNRVAFYDASRKYLGSSTGWLSISGSGTFTTPANAYYMKFEVSSPTYKHDICINISDTNKNGTYEPYQKSVLPLNLNEIRVKSHNIWDEVWDLGSISNAGAKTDGSYLRTVDFIPVQSGVTYYMRKPSTTAWIYYYDKNGTLVQYDGAGYQTLSSSEHEFTPPTGACKIYFLIDTSYGSMYLNDICINESSSFNGQYEPHGILTINGLKQAGSVYDEIVGNKYIKRVGSADLGTLGAGDWTKQSTGNFITNKFNSVMKGASANTEKGNLLSNKLANSVWNTTGTNSEMAVSESSAFFVGASGVDSTSTLVTFLQGVILYYELATPIEYELADEIPFSYPIDMDGTERVVSSRLPATPFVADIQYGSQIGDVARDNALVGISIQHYKSNNYAGTMLDSHVIGGGDNKLYFTFSKPQEGWFTLRTATDEDGGNEQEFEFGTLTTDVINTICTL